MTLPVMPIAFIGHGSPTIALETNDVTRIWRRTALSFPRPRAILCISAHWLTRGSVVTAMTWPRTIHDFGPLNQDLFKIRYPAPGAPDLAARVRELLSPIPVAVDSADWGLDHGTWSVLMKAYPDADIPVVQLSIDMTQPPDWHYAVGRRLGALRDEGVLVMGTGNTVHNLRAMNRDDRHGTPYPWASRFSDATRDAVLEDDPSRLIALAQGAGDWHQANPTPEHFWPLLYAAGARRQGDRTEMPVDHIEYRSVSMTSFVWRPNGAGANG